MSYRPLPESVAELETEVLEAWEAEDTFRRGLEARRDAPEYVFYEGPPTANGRPGVHHLLARTIKGRGSQVPGDGRAPCHPDRRLGHARPSRGDRGRKAAGHLGQARDRAAWGSPSFNQVCRDNVFTYKEDWERLSRRIGYWLDYENAYVTCHAGVRGVRVVGPGRDRAEGSACTRVTRSFRTARGAARVSRVTRWPRAMPSRLRALGVRRSSGSTADPGGASS